MDFQHITIKLFAERADFELHELVPVFHRYIQRNALPGVMMIDVADYAHVPEGPGVMLIAHEGHFSFDVGAIRGDSAEPGVVYANKRKATGETVDRITRSLSFAVQLASLLENEPELADRVKFSTSRMLIRFDDFLLAGNDKESFEAVEADVVRALYATTGSKSLSLSPINNPKTGLTVEATIDGAPPLADLVARITDAAVA